MNEVPVLFGIGLGNASMSPAGQSNWRVHRLHCGILALSQFTVSAQMKCYAEVNEIRGYPFSLPS